jgi:hypothetical protein
MRTIERLSHMRKLTEADMNAFFDKYSPELDIQANEEELKYITSMLNEDWDYVYACEEN